MLINLIIKKRKARGDHVFNKIVKNLKLVINVHVDVNIWFHVIRAVRFRSLFEFYAP